MQSIAKTPDRKMRERMRHDEEIIAAAGEVFSRLGYEAATMDAIARQAQFTKRTLYQYYTSKEALFFAVIATHYRQMMPQLQQLMAADLHGFQKLEMLCNGFYDYCRQHPAFFVLLGVMGRVKHPAPDVTPHQAEVTRFDQQLFHTVARIIREGKADGSIHSDLDTGKTAFSLVFLLTGLMAQLSISGASFTQTFNMELDDFAGYSINLILRSIRRY